MTQIKKLPKFKNYPNSLGPSRNITTMCRKIAFLGVHAEILLSRNKVFLESRAGLFLGSVKKYKFFVEIFTSVPVKKDFCSHTHCYFGVYSVIPGASQKIRPSAQFRTIFGTLVRIWTNGPSPEFRTLVVVSLQLTHKIHIKTFFF